MAKQERQRFLKSASRPLPSMRHFFAVGLSISIVIVVGVLLDRGFEAAAPLASRERIDGGRPGLATLGTANTASKGLDRTTGESQFQDRFAFLDDNADGVAQRQTAAESRDQEGDIRALEIRLISGELDDTAAYTVGEYLVVLRVPELRYLSWVAHNLAARLYVNGLSEENAREAAYLTIISKLTDIGRPEAARSLALLALGSLPESVALRSVMATALADSGNYAAAIDTLTGITDDSVAAQLAIFLYRHGDTDQATRVATGVRLRNPAFADALGEIPDPAAQAH